MLLFSMSLTYYPFIQPFINQHIFKWNPFYGSGHSVFWCFNVKEKNYLLLNIQLNLSMMVLNQVL
jgi:hypothetical protein